MYIAQREFVQAVDLVLKAQEFCQNHASESPNVREASVRLQEKIQHLINVLAGELSTEKSFQGGPRAGMYLTKFYSILLNFTQILLNFTQFYSILLNFTQLYSNLLSLQTMI